MRKQVFTLLAGMALGMALLSGGHAAASAVFTANPSSQTFYLNGRQITLTAFEIGGNNYVKLRDIGKAVDFGVDYDGVTNSVHIDSTRPYQEEEVAPAQTVPPTPVPTAAPAATGSYTISTDHWSREDFSRQANPAVFTGVYDRALYNAIRQTLVDGGPGDAPAYTMVAKGDDYSAVKWVLGRMDNTRWLEHYVPKDFPNYWQHLDYFAVTIKAPEQYQAALNFIQPAIVQAHQLGSDHEKVEYLHDYLCSLLSYDVKAVAVIPQIFTSHGDELKGACGAYASAFSFLCDAANIPCFMVRSTNHSWNMVYADGQWLYVDVSADDLHGNKNALLVETYPRHTDIAPEATAFLKELLIPGSTK